jgi:hypothetical protein
VFGVQQRLGVAPDPAAVPVELQRHQPIHSQAAAGLTDTVVLLRGVHHPVIHQCPQHVDGDTGIGVTLGVGVPVGIRHDPALVELDPIDGA